MGLFNLGSNNYYNLLFHVISFLKSMPVFAEQKIGYEMWLLFLILSHLYLFGK